jgi:eukaryotic-like serine/threonine-protein kinase
MRDGAGEASATAGVALGEVLRGKYRVERVLGSGGMGVVVLATNLRLDQRVAIKLLSKESAQRPTIAARFAREARSAAKLKGEHVVRILDVDDTEDGRPFIVMERLEGEDLDAVLARETALSVPRAVDLVLQACEGLAEAHAAGIVHRDLKPANLFLARRGDRPAIVKLLDFGISKIADPRATDQDVGLTHDSAIVGTPTYMSPEQLKSSRDVDARADLWSLGVVLHQLLSGEPPFPATSIGALAAQIASEPPQPLRGVRGPIPAGLATAIGRCLEKDATRRFATVLELARALAPFASHPPSALDAVARIEATTNAPPQLDSVPMRSVAPDAVTVEAPRVTASLAHTQPASSRVTAPIEAQSVSSSVAGSVTEHPLETARGRAAPRRDRIAIGALVIGVLGVGAWFGVRSLSGPSTPGSSSAALVASAATPSSTSSPPVASIATSTATIASVSATTSASTKPSASLAPATSAKGITTKPAATVKNPLEIQLK